MLMLLESFQSAAAISRLVFQRPVGLNFTSGSHIDEIDLNTDFLLFNCSQFTRFTHIHLILVGDCNQKCLEELGQLRNSLGL